MTTKLDAPHKRELLIAGEPYMLTISPEGLHLARKGRRKGQELRWADLVSGDAALATALNASPAQTSPPRPGARPKRERKPATPAKRSPRAPAKPRSPPKRAR